MRKLLAGYLSWLLALFSAPFLPSPAMASAITTQLQISCLNESIKWTSHTAKAYAKGLIQWNYPHWNKSEYIALVKLWGKESAWNHRAVNNKSTAAGIPQILGINPKTPAPHQIERGLEYIEHRYKKPSVAWAHWRANGWY